MAKGYSLDALVKEHYTKQVASLLTTNINDMWGKDNVGTFPQNQNVNATVANGYPAGAQAGNLEVILTNAGNVDNCIQRYTNFGNLRMWIRSQDQGLWVRTWTPWVELINANNIYNAIYPIGIVLQFDNATNPNNMFTGTVWEQITDGRSVRAATGPEVGTTDGQIGSITGSDTANIAVANLPGHTHGMQNHTHGISDHSHSMAHTHTINHDHGTTTTAYSGIHTHHVSGTADWAGNHTHTIEGKITGNSSNGVSSGYSTVLNSTPTSSAGAHTHSVSGTAESAGDHTHYIDLPNFTGTSGGPSEGWVGNTSLTTWGPSNNNTTSTGDGTALLVRNLSHYYAFWKRVA